MRLKPQLEKLNLGSYIGDDMAIDGGDAEAIFASDNARKPLDFIEPELRTLPFMNGANLTLVFGELDSNAEELRVHLSQ